MESNAKLSVVNLHRFNFVQSLRCGFNKQIYVINDKLFNNINGLSRLWFPMYGWITEGKPQNQTTDNGITSNANCLTIVTQFSNSIISLNRIVCAALWVIMNGKPQFSIFCPFSGRMENDKSCAQWDENHRELLGTSQALISLPKCV